jgi:hypothetical protein
VFSRLHHTDSAGSIFERSRRVSPIVLDEEMVQTKASSQQLGAIERGPADLEWWEGRIFGDG